MEKHVYNLSLKWENDRKGIMSSPELPTTIEVATPPEFDKGMPNIWSPEHFFYWCCFKLFYDYFFSNF